MLLATYMDIVMAMIFRLVICSFAPVSGYWAKVPIFGAMGPYTVTADKISDPDQLEIIGTRNGQEVQHSNTREMIFSCCYLIS